MSDDAQGLLVLFALLLAVLGLIGMGANIGTYSCLDYAVKHKIVYRYTLAHQCEYMVKDNVWMGSESYRVYLGKEGK